MHSKNACLWYLWKSLVFVYMYIMYSVVCVNSMLQKTCFILQPTVNFSFASSRGKELLWWRGDLSACSSVITPPQRKWYFQEKESGGDRGESKSCFFFRFKALSLLSLNRNKGFLLKAASLFLHYAGYHRRMFFVCAVEVQTVMIMCHNTTQICRGMHLKT